MDERLRRELVERASQVVVKLLEEYDVLFVIPPGSSRVEVVSEARRILSEKGLLVEVVSYHELRSTGKLETDELEKRLIDLLKKKATSKYIIVPSDTTSAVVLAREIKEQGIVEACKICFLNIAEIYGKLLDRVEEHFRLDYSHVKKYLESLGIQLRPGYCGISLTLIGRGSVEACSKISALAPEKTRDMENVLRKLRGATPHHLVSTLISVVYNFVEFTLFLKPETRIAIRISRDIVLNAVRAILTSAKKDFEKLLVDFLVKSRDIAGYLDVELYEGVLDHIASKWGLTLAEFKTLIKNLANIASREVATLEDVEKHVQRHLEEYERWFKEIEKRIETLERDLKAITTLHGVYKDINGYPYIRVEGGKYYITPWRERYELATTETYQKLVNEVESKLLTERFVIIEGSSGSGKSVFSHYVIARILEKSREEGVVRRVYVASNLSSERAVEHVSSYLAQVAELAGDLGEHLIIVYDPVPPEIYTTPVARPDPEKIVRAVGRDIELLLEVYSRWRNVSLIVSLPRHMYIRVKEYFEHTMREQLEFITKHTINFDERISTELLEFVKKLLFVYSGCEGVDELALRICKDFKESHALLAKHTGLLLKARNCRVQDIVEFIGEAKGMAKALINIIVRERLGLHRLAKSVREDLLRKYATILAIRVPFAEMLPFGVYIVTPSLMSYFMRFAELQDSEIEKNYDWLSLRNEDLVEETLREVLEKATGVTPDISVPQSVDDAIELILNKWGDKIWHTILGRVSNIDCLKKLFFIIGFTSFEVGSPLEYNETYEKFEKWALSTGFLNTKSCKDLDELIIVNKQTPILTSILLLLSVLKGPPVDISVNAERVDTCTLVTEAHTLIREGAPLFFLPYALGVSLASLRNTSCREDVVSLLEILFTNLTSAGLLHIDLISYVLDHVMNILTESQSEPSILMLIRLYTPVNDYKDVLNVVDRLIKQRERLEPWTKAILVEVLGVLASIVPKHDISSRYFNEAEQLVSEVKQLDGVLGLIAETNLELSIARYLTNLCSLDQAMKSIERAEKNIELISKYASNGLLTRDLVKYLSTMTFSKPEDAIHNELEVLRHGCIRERARVYLAMGLTYGNVEYINKSVELFRQLADLFSGRCLYYEYELKRLVALILADNEMRDELLEELDKLWRNVRKDHCLVAESRVLATLVVVKALLGYDFAEELEISEFLLKRLIPTVRVLTRLFLSSLSKVEKLDFKDVLTTLPSEFRPDLVPLWLLERGLSRRDFDIIRTTMIKYSDVLSEFFGQDVIAEFEEAHSAEQFDDLLRKVGINLYELELENALQLLYDYPDLGGVLEPQYVFELLVPATSLGQFALLLYALAEGNFKLAKAHAKLAEKEYCIELLFSDLHSALEKSERKGKLTKEAKLCLAKILLHHIT